MPFLSKEIWYHTYICNIAIIGSIQTMKGYKVIFIWFAMIFGEILGYETFPISGRERFQLNSMIAIDENTELLNLR